MENHSQHDHHGHNHGAVSSGGSSFEPPEHRSNDDGVLLNDGQSHTGHGAHVDGSSSSIHDSMMSMWFHFGCSETILFKFWKTSEAGSLIGSMAVIFVLSFLYEALKFYREHLYRKSFRTIQYNTVTVPAENGGTVKETQKTVHIGRQSLSVDPGFLQQPEITPIFISTQATCSCPPPRLSLSESVSKIEICSDETKLFSVSKESSNNNLNPTHRVPPCSMTVRKCSTTVSTAYKVKMISWMHTWQTVLHIVQVILSYLLMLIFMTYNVWLCLAVILGAGSGYFFFGWKKSLVVDITEHCH